VRLGALYAAERVYLQLWPDWAPSLAPDLARFSTLVKAGAGERIDDPETIELRMLDARGDIVDVHAETLEPGLEGPAWRQVAGPLVRMAGPVTHVDAALRDAVSERVARADAELPVVLEPVAYDLGLDREPALWWSYRNRTGAPVEAVEVLRSRVLWVDDRPLRPPEGAYNGPRQLAPGRALSGAWSLDDFALIDRRAPRRFALEAGGERSREFTYAWEPMA
jgi:hypothetical protein